MILIFTLAASYIIYRAVYSLQLFNEFLINCCKREQDIHVLVSATSMIWVIYVFEMETCTEREMLIATFIISEFLNALTL